MATRSHLFIFDFETTGTDALDDEPCQVGAVLLSCLDGKRLQSQILMNSTCRTTKPMSTGAAAVHGITPEVMARYPSHRVVLNAFEHLVATLDQYGVEAGDEVYISGYNVEKFDCPMLYRLQPNMQNYFAGTVDAYRLNLRLFPEEIGKLVNFYQNLTGEAPPEDAHDAVADCLMVTEALQKLIFENFPVGDDRSNFAALLHQELMEPCVLDAFPFGKHRGWKLEDIPDTYVAWAVAKMTHVPDEVVWTIEALANRANTPIPASSWLGIRLAELQEGNS